MLSGVTLHTSGELTPGCLVTVASIECAQLLYSELARPGANHPHTNMAKASLNMMTCSVADEFSKEGKSSVHTSDFIGFIGFHRIHCTFIHRILLFRRNGTIRCCPCLSLDNWLFVRLSQERFCNPQGHDTIPLLRSARCTSRCRNLQVSNVTKASSGRDGTDAEMSTLACCGVRITS